MTWRERLGTVGVWRGVNDLDPAMAKTIEKVGFGTIWQGGSPGSDLRPAEELLDATESLHLATGIVNVWRSDPAELADSYHRIEAHIRGGCYSVSGLVTARRLRSECVRLMDGQLPRRLGRARRTAAGPSALCVGSADAATGGRTKRRHAPVLDRPVAVRRSADGLGP